MNLTYKTDKELIQMAKNNGHSNLIIKEIQIRYKNPLSSFVYRMVRDYDTTADIVQETFVKMYNNRDKYDKNKKFSTWLYVIARNTAIDYKRKKDKRKEVRFSELCENDINFIETIIEQTSFPQPDEVFRLKEMWNSVTRQINKLSEEYADMVALSIDGMRPLEIAKAYGIPDSKVRWRLYKARRLLRTKFKKHPTGLIEKI